MESWTVRFESGYLAQQTFFRPYPELLIALTDSGKEITCRVEGRS
jgi:uncharacterized protein YbgA (DUF1722 family)